MNTNKKRLLLLILILVICLPICTNASVLTGAEYVGENICEEESVKKVLVLVGYLLYIAKVAVPLILVVLGTFDIFQAVMGKDEKDLTKSVKTLLLRIVLGIFIFFIPSIVNWAFEVFNDASNGDTNNSCVTCVLDPGNC